MVSTDYLINKLEMPGYSSKGLLSFINNLYQVIEDNNLKANSYEPLIDTKLNIVDFQESL